MGFSSLSPKMSVMPNPRLVNLQPEGMSHSPSTKEGKKAMQERGSPCELLSDVGWVPAWGRQQTSARLQGAGR